MLVSKKNLISSILVQKVVIKHIPTAKCKLDNSAAERAIRDFAVLRHSMPSGFGSVEGAKSTAVFSSFHETCKTHGVDLEDYLEFLFRYMGVHRDELNDESLSDERRKDILEQAMPWKFK